MFMWEPCCAEREGSDVRRISGATHGFPWGHTHMTAKSSSQAGGHREASASWQHGKLWGQKGPRVYAVTPGQRALWPVQRSNGGPKAGIESRYGMRDV